MGNVKTFSPKQRKGRSEKPRAKSHKYLFTCNGEEVRVCKAFFLATLCISNNAVLKAFSNQSDHNTFIGGDKRGHHEPKHKLSAERHQFIKNHIESFPVVESHYCHADTSRKYLEPGLSVIKMHELYKKNAKKNILPLSVVKHTEKSSQLNRI